MGAIADLARQRKAGSRASYILNRYINYSNYCILSCQFCSFARKKRDADGFQLTAEEIVAKGPRGAGAGHHRIAHRGRAASLPALQLLHRHAQALRQLDARLQLKCFTAIEILHLAWLAKKSVAETLGN